MIRQTDLNRRIFNFQNKDDRQIESSKNYQSYFINTDTVEFVKKWNNLLKLKRNQTIY